MERKDSMALILAQVVSSHSAIDAIYPAGTMKTIAQIRLENMLLLLDKCELECGGRGGAALLSRKTGVPQPYISQLRNSRSNDGGGVRTIGTSTARKLERGMEKPEGWMDVDHGQARSIDEADLLDLFRLLTETQRTALQTMAEEFAELNAAKHPGTLAQPQAKRPPKTH